MCTRRLYLTIPKRYGCIFLNQRPYNPLSETNIKDIVGNNPEIIFSDEFKRYVESKGLNTSEAFCAAYFWYWYRSSTVIKVLNGSYGFSADKHWIDIIKGICTPKAIEYILTSINDSKLLYTFKHTEFENLLEYVSIIVLDPKQRYVANALIKVTNIITVSHMTSTIFEIFRAGCESNHVSSSILKLLECCKLFAIRHRKDRFYIRAPPEWLIQILSKFGYINGTNGYIPIYSNGKEIIFDSDVKIIGDI